MSPKEKASKLCQEFGNLGLKLATVNSEGKYVVTLYQMKQQALLAAQTVIDAVPEVINVREYWVEVKSEIDKL